MELINKDEVIAELERRRKIWWYCSSTEAKYRKEEREEILDFINSIETIVEVEIDEYGKIKGNNKPKQRLFEVTLKDKENKE